MMQPAASDEEATIPGSQTPSQGHKSPSKGHGLPKSPALVVMYGQQLGRKFDLDRAELTIGRGDDVEIQIDQPSVSRRHARIDVSNLGAKLVDFNSTNGTLVNDTQVVNERALHHGDYIKVGSTVLKFLTANNLEANYHEAIYRLNTTDGLTGAANRRQFDEALKREVSRSSRHARPLSLLVFDLDNFKALNDTHGHLAGDSVLKLFAQTIAPTVRSEDLFARFGGEEFVLLAPEMTAAQSTLLAERLRKSVEALRFEFDAQTLNVTVSIGVAELKPPETKEDFVKRADANMYAAKAAGKNRVVSEA
jgi:two-component system, cell cycle response regulator